MDVRLSAEQQALRDAAARLAERLGPATVRDLDDDERRARLDEAVTAAGWRDMRTAREDGGAWASGVEPVLVAEELARRVADTAFVGPTLAAELRRLAGAPPATRPETVALASDLSSPAEAGVRPAGGTGVTDGAVAVDACDRGAVLVVVPSVDGVRLGRIDLDEVEVGPVDLTRRLARVPPGTPIGAVEAARPLAGDDLVRWRALGLSLASADLVGAMAGAVGLACDYAAERRQFGTAVGTFQAVQHLLADALVATEGSRSATLHAAWAVDALSPGDALAAAAVAKAYASRAAREVCESAIQVHGGIGNTWECIAHLHLRRALLSTDLFGGAAPNLARVLAHRGLGGDGGLR